MPEAPDFADWQRRFSAHVRDPDGKPRPNGVPDRRMAVYRDLIFDNLSSLLGSAFPVCRTILGDERWSGLIREFLIRHRARTPLFPQLPKEFLRFLGQVHPCSRSDPAFLRELAHYEWVELALETALEPRDRPEVDADGDLLDGVPVLSPLAWILSYRFPVHRIGLGYQPEEPPDAATYLLVYRDFENSVVFTELNAATACLLKEISRGRCTGRQVLAQFASELGHLGTNRLMELGLDLMRDLHARGALLGSRRLNREETLPC